MTAKRLASGGRIDRNQPVTFTWDGKPLQGFAGDTLASALMANNQTILGRSFKYHRPRGIMSAGVEESGAIVSVGKGSQLEPNVKTTMQELHEGLAATGQNAWPNVRTDLGAINNLFGRFFSAGFYYKTFMGLPPFEWGKGTGIWMQYEKLIRKAAGMGTASREADPDSYEHVHGFCDVLVVGAGPAGLNAALTASRAGKDVILVEQDFELGGDLLNDSSSESQSLLTTLVEDVAQSTIRVMTRTSAFGLYDNGTSGLLEKVTDHLSPSDKTPHSPRQRFWTVHSNSTILATGALERHIAFENNDRPGVMTAAAARAYVNRFGVLPGQKIVIATNNDSAYTTADDLANAGADVTIVDVRTDASISVADKVQIKKSLAPLNVLGKNWIKGVELARLNQSHWEKAETLNCDLLLVSGGWSPVVNLLSHRGMKPVWDNEHACFLPVESAENIVMAGSATGVWDTPGCQRSGINAVQNILSDTAIKPSSSGNVETTTTAKHSSPGTSQSPITPIYEVRLKDKHCKSFVDPQHDVTCDDIRLAHQEGFVSVEHLKRYTTLGMATDQGKMGNVIGLALMADALGKDIPEVGTTRFRPPYTPISIGALAGRNTADHFKPLRRTPMHSWNLAQNATMTDAGLWHRPWYFAQNNETIVDAYIREATTTRKTVGICDVSSLGKIAVQGPDSSEFLNRIYTNAFAKLPIGKARYGIMLRDDGMVMDDGTTWRLSENDFLLTTTTSHAAKVMVWLEELLQTRWQDLRVHVTSVSDQWAAASIAGPEARNTIASCLEDPSVISHEALPFMGVVKTTLESGINCLIARISFSGELAFEVYAPAGHGENMMDLLWQSAKESNGCLYGLEALGALRIEKGHVTGAELDGRVTIDDAGLGKMASPNKSYIGSVLRQRPELTREDRPRLVGIFPKDKQHTFNGGALLCKEDELTGFGEGWVTAVTHSPALGHWIGLGYIAGGVDAWANKSIVATDPVRKENINVEIVSPHMFDPDGERMHA